MALTAAQIRSVFECLEVPYSTSYYTTDGMGALSAQTDVSGATTGQAKTVLTSAIAALGSDEETKVAALIVEWDAVSLNVGEITSGGVSDLSGLSFSWDQKRKLIKERMQIYLPFFRVHERLAKARSSMAYIPLVR